MTRNPDDLLKSAQATLEEARAAIEAEIRRYPRPISGCDAQFNHLLAQRIMARRALGALSVPPPIPTSRNPDPARAVAG